MKSAFVGVLSIIELKNARWNIEIIRMNARRIFPTYTVDRNDNLTYSGSTVSNFFRKLHM